MAYSEEYLNEEITVTQSRRAWMVVVAAAASYDSRVPLEQGDGGACLDVIREAAGISP